MEHDDNDSQSSSIIDNDRAWRYLQHADTQDASRSNFSLVAESMLIVAYFMVSPGTAVTITLRIAVCLLGTAYTLAWLYVSVRLNKRMQPLHKHLKENDATYRIFLEAVRGPSATLILSWALPLATLAFWLVLLWLGLCSKT